VKVIRLSGVRTRGLYVYKQRNKVTGSTFGFFIRAGLLPGDLFGGFSFLVDRVEYDYK
jgi:hypothetical protein